MKTTKNKTDEPTKNIKKDVVKSIAWLIEAAFRGFVGYILLANFHSYLTIAVAIYSLLTAALIVIVHFVNAHKN